MSKNSSAKYYQDNKERLQKRLVKDIKIFLKKKKKKTAIWTRTIQKSLRRWKQKLVSIQTKIIKSEKMPCYNYKKKN